jgi:hypothetical protein
MDTWWLRLPTLHPRPENIKEIELIRYEHEHLANQAV